MNRAAFAKHLRGLQFHNETISVYFRMLDGHKEVVLRDEIFECINRLAAKFQ